MTRIVGDNNKSVFENTNVRQFPFKENLSYNTYLTSVYENSNFSDGSFTSFSAT